MHEGFGTHKSAPQPVGQWKRSAAAVKHFSPSTTFHSSKDASYVPPSSSPISLTSSPSSLPPNGIIILAQITEPTPVSFSTHESNLQSNSNPPTLLAQDDLPTTATPSLPHQPLPESPIASSSLPIPPTTFPPSFTFPSTNNPESLPHLSNSGPLDFPSEQPDGCEPPNLHCGETALVNSNSTSYAHLPGVGLYPCSTKPLSPDYKHSESSLKIRKKRGEHFKTKGSRSVFHSGRKGQGHSSRRRLLLPSSELSGDIHICHSPNGTDHVPVSSEPSHVIEGQRETTT